MTYIGVIIRNYTGDTDEGIINFQVMMAETIRAAVAILKPGEKVCYTYQKLQGNHTTIDDFIKDMDYVAVTPDDVALYDKEASNGIIDKNIF